MQVLYDLAVPEEVLDPEVEAHPDRNPDQDLEALQKVDREVYLGDQEDLEYRGLDLLLGLDLPRDPSPDRDLNLDHVRGHDRGPDLPKVEEVLKHEKLLALKMW